MTGWDGWSEKARGSRPWQLATELKQRVYAFTETGPASRDFKFRDEIRAAARSASDNTAEGFYRYAPREFNRFVNIARGSLGEVRNQLLHARGKVSD
jgi:four helix bundle protein